MAVAKVNMKNHFYGLATGRFIVMKNHFYDLVCGHVIVARAYGAGAASGGCFNLAVAIGLYVASYCLVYTACEVVGALLAAGLFRVFLPINFGGKAGLFAKCTKRVLGDVHLVTSPSFCSYSSAASLRCMIYS